MPNRDDILEFSPTLADKVALQSNIGVSRLAHELLKQIRPDLLARLHRRIAHRHATSSSDVEMIDPNSIKSCGAPVHDKLPAELLGRVRLLRAAMLPAYPHSLAFWLDGFRRDSHPTKEVR